MTKAITVVLLILLFSACTKQGGGSTANKADSVASISVAVAPATSAKSVATPTPAKTYDGPFGLAMGIPIGVLVDDLKFTVSTYDAEVFSGIPPKPIDDVSRYAVVATKEQGICKIIASVNVPVVNGTGSQVKAETDRLAEMFAVKYGRHTKKFDFASEDVFRRSPDLWFYGLQKGSVTYAYAWTTDKKAPLSNEIENIMLTAVATSSDKGEVRISYELRNFDACLAEMKKKSASRL